MNQPIYPVGPVGKPTELHLMFPILAMINTKYPQACKALIALHAGSGQLNKMDAVGAGLSQPLPQRLRRQSGMDGGSKTQPYRDVASVR